MLDTFIFCGKRVHIHSMVDVITNSSSVVYMWPTSNTVKRITEIIQNFMIALGVSGTPEDHFKIEICVDPEGLDYLIESLYDRYDVYGLPDESDPTSVRRYQENFAELWEYTMPAGTSPTNEPEKDEEAIRQYFLSLSGPDLFDKLPITNEIEAPDNVILKVTSRHGDQNENLVEGIMWMFETAACMG